MAYVGHNLIHNSIRRLGLISDPVLLYHCILLEDCGKSLFFGVKFATGLYNLINCLPQRYLNVYIPQIQMFYLVLIKVSGKTSEAVILKRSIHPVKL